MGDASPTPVLSKSSKQSQVPSGLSNRSNPLQELKMFLKISSLLGILTHENAHDWVQQLKPVKHFSQCEQSRSVPKAGETRAKTPAQGFIFNVVRCRQETINPGCPSSPSPTYSSPNPTYPPRCPCPTSAGGQKGEREKIGRRKAGRGLNRGRKGGRGEGGGKGGRGKGGRGKGGGKGGRGKRRGEEGKVFILQNNKYGYKSQFLKFQIRI